MLIAYWLIFYKFDKIKSKSIFIKARPQAIGVLEDAAEHDMGNGGDNVTTASGGMKLG